jgi:hypothetical protein
MVDVEYWKAKGFVARAVRSMIVPLIHGSQGVRGRKRWLGGNNIVSSLLINPPRIFGQRINWGVGAQIPGRRLTVSSE